MGIRSTDTPLGRAITGINMNFKEFAEKMGTPYYSFMYNVRSGKFTIDELHKMSHLTGKSFEDLFPSPFVVTPKKIELNLSTAVSKARPEKAKKKRETVKSPSAPSPIPVENQQTQQVPPPGEDDELQLQDIYNGGLPGVS